MSAMPPTATESMRRNEMSLCATTGREQAQQTEQLFDHLIGAGEQRGWSAAAVDALVYLKIGSD
jgi:hypothetical protein